MSVSVERRVWDCAIEAGGTDLVVLLALAHLADDDGMCYPGIDYLARQSRTSVRNVQKAIRKLEERGYLYVSYEACRKFRTNLYFVRCGLNNDEAAATLTRIFESVPYGVEMANSTMLFGAVINQFMQKPAGRVNSSSPSTRNDGGELQCMGEPQFTLEGQNMSENDNEGELQYTHRVNPSSPTTRKFTQYTTTTINKDPINLKTVVVVNSENENFERRDLPSEDANYQNRLQALKKAGIQGTKRESLAKKECLSAEIIQGFEADLKRQRGDKYRPGLLVYVLEEFQEGDPAPSAQDPADPMRYVTGKYAAFIDH